METSRFSAQDEAMLAARSTKWGSWLFTRYLNRLFRRSFHVIRFSGEYSLLESEEAFPLILYSNHQTWWDGLLEWPVITHFRLNHLLMMEEKNLRRFPFFRRVGVFGVDLDSRSGRSAGLLYAIRGLRDGTPRRTLILYPQGQLLPAHEGWRSFQPGLEKILQAVPRARAIPVAKHLRMGRFPKPEVILHFGPPQPGGATAASLEEALLATMREAERDSFAWLPEDPKGLQRT